MADSDEWSSLRKRVDDKQKQHDELERKIPKLLAMEEDLTERIGKGNRFLAKIHEEIDALRPQIDEMKAEAAREIQAERDKLGIQQREFLHYKEEATEKLDARKLELDQREDGLDELIARNTEREVAITEGKAALDTQLAELETKNTELAALKDGLDNMKIELAIREKSIVASEDDLKQRQEALAVNETEILENHAEQLEATQEAKRILDDVLKQEIEVKAEASTLKHREATLNAFEADLNKRSIKLADRERVLKSNIGL